MLNMKRGEEQLMPTSSQKEAPLQRSNEEPREFMKPKIGRAEAKRSSTSRKPLKRRLLKHVTRLQGKPLNLLADCTLLRDREVMMLSFKHDQI